MKKDKIYAHSDMQDPWPSFLLDWNKYGNVDNLENWLGKSEVCNFQVYIRPKRCSKNVTKVGHNKVSFFLQCSKVQLIPLKKLTFKLVFSNFFGFSD